MTSTIKVNTVTTESGSTLTIGESGKTIALASGASQSGFGRTGTVDWQTSIKTTSFTAVSGEGYFVNTTSEAITVTLPASPSAGDIVSVKDYAQTFDTNACTIGRNSQPIEGQTFDLVLAAEGSATTLVYGDATKGWQAVNSNEITNTAKYVAATGGTETTSGDYKIHTFTGPGTFTISCSGNPAGNVKIDYLVVAGGGGGAGGGCGSGGGAGAGGFRESQDPSAAPAWTASPLKSTTSLGPLSGAIPVTVGAGGAGGPNSAPTGGGTSGNNSVFSTITSAGGGAGGGPSGSALSGGSGGGASNSIHPIGSGNTPPVSPPQGNDGAIGAPGSGGHDASGGGGGATAAGTAGQNPGPGGPGGAGATTNITASPVAYAGGGGGGKRGCGSSPSAAGSGGTGGGGNGGPGNAVGSNGTANTGGGAGGGAFSGGGAGSGGTGGSGIVVIRYKFQN